MDTLNNLESATVMGARVKQATLISLYGNKTADFATLIHACQESVASVPGISFTPYDPAQIHGTILGLERKPGSTLFNANFAKYRGRDVVMDLDGLLNYLRICGHIPLEIQIGGYSERGYSFTSRNAIPYERSFSIQGDKVVMMGWPVRGNPPRSAPTNSWAWAQETRVYPPTLDIIRHAAQRFGFLHAYHRALTDVDGDLFFRIGLIDPDSLPQRTRVNLEAKIRKFLSEQSPLVLGINADEISVAAYLEDTLPLTSTKIWPLTDPSLCQTLVLDYLDSY